MYNPALNFLISNSLGIDRLGLGRCRDLDHDGRWEERIGERGELCWTFFGGTRGVSWIGCIMIRYMCGSVFEDELETIRYRQGDMYGWTVLESER